MTAYFKLNKTRLYRVLLPASKEALQFTAGKIYPVDLPPDIEYLRKQKTHFIEVNKEGTPVFIEPKLSKIKKKAKSYTTNGRAKLSLVELLAGSRTPKLSVKKASLKKVEDKVETVLPTNMQVRKSRAKNPTK